VPALTCTGAPARTFAVDQARLPRSLAGDDTKLLDVRSGGTLAAEVVVMLLDVAPEPVPLMADRDGVVRVGSTRVTLDTVVAAFRAGATAEEIAQQYPSVDLVDIYAVVTYYLRHCGEVEEYLRARERIGAEVRAVNEDRFDPVGIRERLLARRNG